MACSPIVLPAAQQFHADGRIFLRGFASPRRPRQRHRLYAPILGLDKPLRCCAGKEALPSLYGKNAGTWIAFPQALERGIDIKRFLSASVPHADLARQHYFLESALPDHAYHAVYHCHPLVSRQYLMKGDLAFCILYCCGRRALYSRLKPLDIGLDLPRAALNIIRCLHDPVYRECDVFGAVAQEYARQYE